MRIKYKTYFNFINNFFLNIKQNLNIRFKMWYYVLI